MAKGKASIVVSKIVIDDTLISPLDPRHARAVVADVTDLAGAIYVAPLDLLIGKKRTGDTEGFAHPQQLAGNVGVHGKLGVHKVFLSIFQ